MFQSASQLVPATLLSMSVVTALGNWYLRPERSYAWAASLAVMAVMAVALLVAGRRWAFVPQCARNSVGQAVSLGSLVMLVPLLAKLGQGLGLLEEADFARRFTMASFGILLVVVGNAMPKTLQPLARMTCDVAAVQAFQRFAVGAQGQLVVDAAGDEVVGQLVDFGFGDFLELVQVDRPHDFVGVGGRIAGVSWLGGTAGLGGEDGGAGGE